MSRPIWEPCECEHLVDKHLYTIRSVVKGKFVQCFEGSCDCKGYKPKVQKAGSKRGKK